ncbi:YbaB/EbfC family nucleoid-associated protein [Nocardia brasiliensis]|uniref:YbaB/EbfC family nucleoid-associated protein n=1 Tax=Nocardia brasiliensis TaxID=37326 RepID=UPI0037BA2062
MDPWRRENLCSVNTNLRNQVDCLLDALEQQRAQAAEVRKELADLRTTAKSTDRLVAVTVDADGAFVDLRITAAGIRKTPDVLQRSIIEAAQAATAHAKKQSAAMIRPISSATAEIPGLIPDAPGIQDSYGHRDT